MPGLRQRPSPHALRGGRLQRDGRDGERHRDHLETHIRPDRLDALQAEYYAAFAQLSAGEVNAETATAASSDLAAKVHAACVELVNSVK